MWLLLACPSPDRTLDPLAPGPGTEEMVVEFILDPGRMVDGTWISEPDGGTLGTPTPIEEATGSFHRFAARVPPGRGTATVSRPGCGPADIPYTALPGLPVDLPYPVCSATDAIAIPGSGMHLDRTEVTAGAYAAIGVVDPSRVLSQSGLDPEGPVIWVDWEEARTYCAWLGAALPSVAQWRAVAGITPPRVHDGTRQQFGSAPEPAPPTEGWIDLRGNVAEWLDDGTVAGGSWQSRPGEFEITEVPPLARSDTIGFRCVRAGVP